MQKKSTFLVGVESLAIPTLVHRVKHREELVGPKGIEPLTLGLKVRCSNQLS